MSTETPAPELSLSLLSGCFNDISRISTQQRHNIPDFKTPFPTDPKRLTDFLDALAAVCVRKATGQVFFVSLAVGAESQTLYLSSNETVPSTVTTHLNRIRSQLTKLHQFPSTMTDDNSPNPNHTEARAEHELEILKMIYEYSYAKLRKRFLKRAPTILRNYASITDVVKSKGISGPDAKFLQHLHLILKGLREILRPEKPPTSEKLNLLISSIKSLSADERLKEEKDGNIFSQWDQSICNMTFAADERRLLSLRRLIEKICTLHRHIRTIIRVAWSHRLGPFIFGENFKIVRVPAKRANVAITFSPQTVFSVIFPEGNEVKRDIQEKVYDKLMKGLKRKMDDEGLGRDSKKRTTLQLSLDTNVHAECTLLAYLLQHRNDGNPDPYAYFGGSKLSCHACATFFAAYNLVAAKSNLPIFFTKGSHNKIYLRWTYPSLLSQEDQHRLQSNKETLDTRVRTEMASILNMELANYVNELCVDAQAPSPTLSDSTDASGDSHQSGESLEEISQRMVNIVL